MKSFSTSLKPKVTMQENFDFPPKVLYENRYCNQDDFSVLVCGRSITSKIVNSVYKLNGPKFECETYTSIPNELEMSESAVVNSELFIFGGYLQNEKFDKHNIKFCNKTKTWSSKAQLPLKDNCFCVCSFKKNLYVIYKTG